MTMTKVKRKKRYWNEEEICTKGCGRSNHVNAVTLGRRGAELLLMLHTRFRGEADQPTMALSGSDYATISRTRYWGLTIQPEGMRQGTYRITDDGYAFIAGDLTIYQTLYQFDNRIIDREGPMVSIRDILEEEYQTYEEIIATVRATRRPATREELDANIARKQPPPPPGSLRDFG